MGLTELLQNEKMTIGELIEMLKYHDPEKEIGINDIVELFLVNMSGRE